MLCPGCERENPSDAQFCNGCGARLDAPAPEAPAPLPDPPADGEPPISAFIGRHREMQDLKAALDNAHSGQGRLVMLGGEAGIGKTRTAQELAAFAEGQGFLVWWGRCYEDEGMPPYWPWVQSMRSYLQQVISDQLRSQMGSAAAAIAEIIPELRERLTDLEPPPPLDPEQARFRLFDSIATFLKNTARSQPLVLVLDDLHWSDRSSLLLLQFLAREIRDTRLLVVGTYREGELSRRHPLLETLAHASREPVFRRALLRGLGQEDARQFIEATGQVRPSRRLVEMVYTHTEGNPFFMAEVIRLLAQSGQPGAAELSWDQGFRIPAGVREVIGNRLNKLSPQCNQTMVIAAIIGREFDFRLLRLLTGATTEEALLDLVDEALEFRVIEESHGALERYQFCHSLIQETLAGELSAARRVRLHARIGEALEEMYGASANERASELVYHFAQARPALGTDKLVKYSLIAGEGALGVYAYEEALEHFERALAAKRGLPMDRETADLLLGLGRAQDAAFGKPRFAEAVENLRRAFDYYVEAGDVDRAVAIAGYPFQFWTEPPPGVFSLIEQGLTLVSPESRQAGPLWLSYGRMQGIEQADYPAAASTFERALEIAQHYEDAALEAHILAFSATVDFFHLHLSECLDKIRRATHIARSVGDPRIEANCEFWASFVLATQGNLHQARLGATASLTLAERVDRGLTLANALWVNNVLAEVEGDWDAARSFCDRGEAVWPGDLRVSGSLMTIEYMIGDFAQGKGYLETLLEVLSSAAPGPTIEHAAAAYSIPLVAVLDDLPEGLKASEASAEYILSSPQATPFLILMARIGLAMISVRREDAAGASAYYGLLAPQSKGILLVVVSGDRLLGLLSRTMGELDLAAAHFEDALAFCRDNGCRPELAWTCHDYAGTLLAGEEGRVISADDRARVDALLEEGLSMSRTLGMVPLTERLTNLMERAQSVSTGAPAYPDGLTQREIDVLLLIARGKSNREIADELIISPNTVGSHVGNIFNKIGAANRTEAATYASRHGLLPW